MNFNGDRLKIARIYRNMTISDLEKKISVTKQAISQYEKGTISPKSEVLFQLVFVLRFPLDFFYEVDKRTTKIENTFFRSLSSAKTLDLNTQEVKAEIIVRLYNFLNDYVNFPKLKLPAIDYKNVIDIEDVTLTLRGFWGLNNDPIENIVGLLEKNGIIVSSLATDTTKISAFTQVHKINDHHQFCVVLGNDKRSMVRRNFDAAHELGHIILHSKLINIKELSKEEFKKMEVEANQFATSFLLPKNNFFADLVNPTNLEAYLNLKKKWKVSVSAMVVRAKQLGRINSLQYQNLMKLISYKKWVKVEPYDDVWQIQPPQLFRKAIKILKESNVLTGQQLMTELSKYKFTINVDEVEVLLDLEPGTLVEKRSEKDKGLILSIKSD
ncbi:XRE family transcriptional regulator [Clostridium bowmanii]|uniref:helix-turn-helix domain-containing protein n=1 Tax=Clostridium bowmanii TaxID=132925 RepID=UPI001C0C525D|nr:XRE family transcriptional regulator [Clostridium bowmanii]MBU3188216.1 XRE family transcriptional regulator [Clostridium bowmanii]MCA1072602.1 XRE family transcriptional regulator [Clostridium bowmanii]